jgi:hypothetical protein
MAAWVRWARRAWLPGSHIVKRGGRGVSARAMCAAMVFAVLILAAAAQGQPARGGTLSATGLRPLGESEAQAVRGATGQGWKCNSAVTQCGPELGCSITGDGQQCLWVCARWQYKFCIYDPPYGYCVDEFTGPCCRKKYCPLNEGHCNDPDHYACVGGRGCTNPVDCSDHYSGCEVFAEGMCIQH